MGFAEIGFIVLLSFLTGAWLMDKYYKHFYDFDNSYTYEEKMEEIENRVMEKIEAKTLTGTGRVTNLRTFIEETDQELMKEKQEEQK